VIEAMLDTRAGFNIHSVAVDAASAIRLAEAGDPEKAPARDGGV
jgi:hypothetical protein